MLEESQNSGQTVEESSNSDVSNIQIVGNTSQP